MYTDSIEIEWDPAKDCKNLEKHGVSLEQASQVFEGTAVTFVDDRRDYGEARYITLGLLNDRIMVITHTPREDKIRIISMRKANEREKKIYQKRLEENRCHERRGY